MLSHILSFIDKSSEIIGKTVAWMCLAMILVLIFEVTARYLLNKPTEWAHESTTMLYGTFCIIGAVWTLRDQGHVRTEVVYQVLPLKMQQFSDIVSGIIVLVMLAVFFYAAVEFAAESWRLKEVSSKSTWGVVVYPFKTVIPIAVFLMFFQQLAHTVRDIAALLGHRIGKPALDVVSDEDMPIGH